MTISPWCNLENKTLFIASICKTHLTLKHLIHVSQYCWLLDHQLREGEPAYAGICIQGTLRPHARKFPQTAAHGAIRDQLIDVEPESTTICEVASQWGMTHFGRFSVEYRQLFGESPSQSLARRRSFSDKTLLDVLT